LGHEKINSEGGFKVKGKPTSSGSSVRQQEHHGRGRAANNKLIHQDKVNVMNFPHHGRHCLPGGTEENKVINFIGASSRNAEPQETYSFRHVMDAR